MSHPVDLHVGARIRARRHAIEQSQQGLADRLGVSFQQVQKYERGRNRVSASMLWEIAQAQEVPVWYYFDGLEGGHAAEVRQVDQQELARVLRQGGLKVTVIPPAVSQ